MNPKEKEFLDACKYNKIDKVEELIKEGVDINVMNEYEQTALHVACFNGKIGIVTLLIKSGVDVNMKDGYGHTALHVACHSNHSNKLELFKLLIDAGVDINTQDIEGYTALHHICAKGNFIIVQDAKTALNYSFKNKNLFIIQDIINKNSKFCYIVLHYIFMNENLSILKEFKKYGADFNIEDNRGFKALHYVFDFDYLDINKFNYLNISEELINFL